MQHKLFHIVFICWVSFLLTSNLSAQRVSFGTSSSIGITLTPIDELDFNLKKKIILASETVIIGKGDEGVGILSIDARPDLDVTVTIDAPASLNSDEHSIGLAVRFAYSNTLADQSAAENSAILVPADFTSVTFPMSKRLSGLPLPPPTPDHVGASYSQATRAYLFIYGTIVVPAGAAAGNYIGTITVRVEYAKYD